MKDSVRKRGNRGNSGGPLDAHCLRRRLVSQESLIFHNLIFPSFELTQQQTFYPIGWLEGTVVDKLL
jgi:hypothetical protein